MLKEKKEYNGYIIVCLYDIPIFAKTDTYFIFSIILYYYL